MFQPDFLALIYSKWILTPYYDIQSQIIFSTFSSRQQGMQLWVSMQEGILMNYASISLQTVRCLFMATSKRASFNFG